MSHTPEPRSPLLPEDAPRLFPRGVGDPFCPNGGLIGTPTDHRLLWHLETVLAVSAPGGSEIARARADLRKYLNVRCDHHWHYSPADDPYSETWQCLWCCDVLVQSAAPIGTGEVCQPDDALEYWPTAVADSDPRERGL